jgi:hypothetical protein
MQRARERAKRVDPVPAAWSVCAFLSQFARERAMSMKPFYVIRVCIKICPAVLLTLAVPDANAGSHYGMGASSRAKIYTQTIKARTTAATAKDKGLRSSLMPGGTLVNLQSKRNGGCGDLSVGSVTDKDIKGDVTVISRGTVINVCK